MTDFELRAHYLELLDYVDEVMPGAQTGKFKALADKLPREKSGSKLMTHLSVAAMANPEIVAYLKNEVVHGPLGAKWYAVCKILTECVQQAIDDVQKFRLPADVRTKAMLSGVADVFDVPDNMCQTLLNLRHSLDRRVICVGMFAVCDLMKLQVEIENKVAWKRLAVSFIGSTVLDTLGVCPLDYAPSNIIETFKIKDW